MRAWFDIPLWKKVFAGLFLGAVVGFAVRLGLGPDAAGDFAGSVFKPFGDIFVRLIRMLVVPLIFFTLISGIVAIGNPLKLGTIGGRAFLLYLITTWFAVGFGLAAAITLSPGRGVDLSLMQSDTVVSQKLEQASMAAPISVVERLIEIIPSNPFRAMVEGDVLAIIFFAIVLGLTCLFVGEPARPLTVLANSVSDVMLKLTFGVMQLAPVGVFFLMSWVTASIGLSILDNFALLALSLFAACVAHIVLIYGLGIIRVLLNLPVRRFFFGIREAQLVAFSTSTSSGTLPVTISNVTGNLGVGRPVAASVLPIGATVNMDGTAAYLGIIAVFASQVLGLSLGVVDFALIGLTAMLASVGTAAVPSASLFLATVVLSVLHGPDGARLIPDEQAVLIVAMIFPFDRPLDMLRTLTNVTGDAAVSVAVAKWDGQLDETRFMATEQPMASPSDSRV